MISRKSIEIVFQPISELLTGKVVGAEALSRFRAEPLRPPNEWFAEAGGVGLGEDLELMAVETALESLDQIPDDMFLSVNVSPKLIVSGALERVAERLPMARLVVELTEHARIDDYTPLTNRLAKLGGYGLRSAVDDAGAGFASLHHILKLRPALIKLDITLTRGIDSDPVRRAMASSLVAFGNEVGAQIVAEGIETPAEHKTLSNLGVHLGQGFYMARPGPLPVPTLIRLMAQPQ